MKNKMKLVSRIAAFAALSLALIQPCFAESEKPAAAKAAKPNILYIVSDDLGWKDVGFHGSDIRTPNLDKLAANGAELNQFYTQPLCTPSRAALMTGRYPFRYGLQTGVILGGQTYGLATDEYLLPQALKSVGYKTAIVGKWHLGHGDSKYWPRQRGFDYQYGPLLGEIDYFTHKEHGVVDWYRDNKKVDEPGYVTQLLGADAVKLIEKHDTSVPLFLYLTFTAPHAPYQAPQNYIDQYKNIEEPTRRIYAGMITCMDDEIGKVLAALDKRGMRENTLIVFQSDNGGNRSAMFAGELDVSKLKLPSDNGPYREGKGTLYEGGTRVVAFANWPGHVKPGKVEQAIHMTDMYPTLAALVGASTEKSKPMDGVNAWSAISEGGKSDRTEVVYNVEPFRGAVRQGDWKLIWRTPLPSALELYNVAQDPSEKNDLAKSNPEKVAELQKRIEELARQSEKPHFLVSAMAASRANPAPPVLPNDDSYFNQEP
ncbi:MAG: arylsulfatase [Bdellovibrionota bacterium]